MTKRWSSTRSDLTKTKKQASREARRSSEWIIRQLDDACRRVASWPAWRRNEEEEPIDPALTEGEGAGKP